MAPSGLMRERLMSAEQRAGLSDSRRFSAAGRATCTGGAAMFFFSFGAASTTLCGSLVKAHEACNETFLKLLGLRAGFRWTLPEIHTR